MASDGSWDCNDNAVVGARTLDVGESLPECTDGPCRDPWSTAKLLGGLLIGAEAVAFAPMLLPTAASAACSDGNCTNEVLAANQPSLAQQMAARFEQLRPTIEQSGKIGSTRNVALAQYNINGVIDEIAGICGLQNRPGVANFPARRLFQTQTVGPMDRVVDAEYKILENIAQQYASSPGVYNNIKGTVNLWTRYGPCESCRGVIEQFQQTFPNVTVNTVWGP